MHDRYFGISAKRIHELHSTKPSIRAQAREMCEDFDQYRVGRNHGNPREFPRAHVSERTELVTANKYGDIVGRIDKDAPHSAAILLR